MRQTASMTRMGRLGEGVIRQYVNDDADEVCALHQRIFVDGLPPGTTGSQFRAHMLELTEGNPWRARGIGPLVLEDPAGKIRGFICVAPRRFLLGDRPVLGAVCSTMCIDKEYEGFSGAQMLRQVLAGPQEFSITDDATDLAAQVAAYSGWTICQMKSVRWTIPLRPVSLALSSVLNRMGMAWARRLGGGVASLLDGAARRLPQSPARVTVDTSLSPRPMDVDAMAAALPRMSRGFQLRVDYDRESLDWILRRARRMTHAGEARMAMICELDGSVAGWYTYYLQRQGLGDVVQFVARPRFRRRVFDWMAHDAWQAGAAGLTGRLDPDTLEVIANQYCLFQPPPHWMLVNSRDPELARTVLEGGALLSRLDGEWAHHFLPSASSVRIETQTIS